MIFDRLIASTRVYKFLQECYDEQVTKIIEMANRSDNLEEELKQLKSDHAFLVSEREEFKNTLTSCEERFEELESKSIELMNANIKLQDFVVNLQCENDLLKSELTSRSSGGVLQ